MIRNDNIEVNDILQRITVNANFLNMFKFED